MPVPEEKEYMHENGSKKNRKYFFLNFEIF